MSDSYEPTHPLHDARRTTHDGSRITHHASRTTHHASRITHYASRAYTLARALLYRLISYLPIPEKEATRFIKFAMVGTLGAAIDFSLLNFFHFVLGWTKFWANTGSFSIGVLSNFTWNRLWTFPESRSRPIHTQLPMFFGVYIIGYIINQTVFLSSDAYIYSHFFAPALSVNLAKATANIIGLFWNFGANRISTYRGL